MKIILFSLSMLVCSVGLSQSKNCTSIPENTPKESKIALKKSIFTYDGTFYIITDKNAPESFTNDIYNIVVENRSSNKDIKMELGSRSTLVIFSESKIQKDNFIPIKTMIKFK